MKALDALIASLQDELQSLEKADRQHLDQKRFVVAEMIVKVFDAVTGSAIVPLPGHVRDLVRQSNRVCRLRIDGQDTGFGTGLLVGKEYVLTAAHLFFNEDRTEVDTSRPGRVSVEFATMYLGDVVAAGHPKMCRLASGPNWAVDPRVVDGRASREVKDLDYLIIKVTGNPADDLVGKEPRGFTRIPVPRDCPLLREERPLRTLQYIDPSELRTSAGSVRGTIAGGGLRMRYSASTVDGASGAPVFDDRLRLAALHIGGSSDPSVRQNEALPMRRVTEAIPPEVRALLDGN